MVESYGPDDALVEMDVSSKARRKDSSLPQTWRMRAVRYHRPGHQPSTLLTSLIDPVAYSSKELVALYHERWELELSYDELKTDLLDRRESRAPTFARSARAELYCPTLRARSNGRMSITRARRRRTRQGGEYFESFPQSTELRSFQRHQ
ncbi:hypothetical protein [Sorangium sp. So ce1335]|uniref:hypothetical protein n=1 Tax=Sorangium sp. So ce1335 TaxID=3133335 RepID=UPI003F633F56